MLVLRRLVLVLVTAALLSTAAYGVGWAMRTTSTDLPSAVGTGGVRTDRPTPESGSPRPTEPTRSTTPTQEPTPTREPTPTLRPGPELLGPGDQGDGVRDLQARLKQIYWFQGDVTGTYGEITTAAVRGFQAKREIPVTGVVDQRTLDRLHAMTSAPTEAELLNRVNQPGALDARCRTGRVLCVDKTSRTLRWVVDGKVLQTLDVRFGASTTPTREGVFHVYLKDADHVSHLYGSSMPLAMFFSGGQAVHYSSDFATVGYAGASHGCVNVRDYDGLQRLYDQVRVGDAVVVYWS